MDFLQNLSMALAHTLVLDSRLTYPGCEHARCGGDEPPSQNQIAAASMKQYIKSFPKMVGVTLPQILPIAQAQLNAAQQTTPGYNALQTSEYAKNAPLLAQAGANADAISRTSQANTDAAILGGPAQEVARQQIALDKQVNPEWYSMRSSLAPVIQQMLTGGLSGGETEAIQRSVNQSNVRRGVQDVPTSTSTVANAMQFGDAARNRQLQGLGAAQGFLGLSRAAFDPAQTVLGRPTSNTGTGQFLGVQKPGDQAFSMGQNQMGNLFGAQTATQQMQFQARDTLDRVNQTTRDQLSWV